MKRKTFWAAVFILACLMLGRAASANDVYIAQAQAGSGDGSSCGNARPVNYFNSSANWGTGATQIGPGTTIHLCGQIVGAVNANVLTFQGSGAVGNPLTLFFETGASILSPYCLGYSTGPFNNGCIYTNQKTDLVIDGGVNGTLQNTSNGTGKQYQQGSTMMYLDRCDRCVVKNLTIGNVYVHQVGDTQGGSAYGLVVRNGTGVTIGPNVSINNARWALYPVYAGQNGLTNLTFAGTQQQPNKISNSDHCIGGGDGSGNSSMNGFTIHDVVFTDCGVNWDEPNDSYHHNFIHFWAVGGGSTINGFKLYNFKFVGDIGVNNTAWINLEVASNNTNNAPQIFNGIIQNGSSAHLSPYGYISTGAVNGKYLNITILGSSTSQGVMNGCFYIGSAANGTQIQNVVCNTVGVFLSKSNAATTLGPFNYNNWSNGGGFYNQGSYQTLAQWQASCHCDANSNQAAPNVNTTTYIPNSGSALITGGLDLSGLGIQELLADYYGVPRVVWGQGAVQASGSTIQKPQPPVLLGITQ